MAKVYAAVGHGIKDSGIFDPGASDGTWNEQSAGDYIVERLAKRLRGWGVEVRDEAFQDDPNYTGSARAANAWGADIAVEVHHDWSGAPPGSFGHWYSGATAAQKLADAIQSAVGAAGFPLRPDWHKARNLAFTRLTNAPAVLYEVGRIGQQELDTADELRAIGDAIALGIANYLGLDVKTPGRITEEDMLQRPDQGNEVRVLQWRLNDQLRAMTQAGLYDGELLADDGIFGSATEAAVKEVQEFYGFKRNPGKVDLATYQRLTELAIDARMAAIGARPGPAGPRGARGPQGPPGLTPVIEVTYTNRPPEN